MLSRIRSVPLLLVLCAGATLGGCASPVEPSPIILTPSGLGVVRLGMTLVQAQTALGAALDPMPAGSGEACWMTRRSDSRAPEVFYTIQNGRITRIDINNAASAGTPSPVTTAEGVGVGASEADVLQAYGKAAKVTPGKSDEPGHTIIVESPETKSALAFETSDGKVTRFRVGFHPTVDRAEACS